MRRAVAIGILAASCVISFTFLFGSGAVFLDGYGVGRVVTTMVRLKVLHKKTALVRPTAVVYCKQSNFDHWLAERKITVVDDGIKGSHYRRDGRDIGMAYTRPFGSCFVVETLPKNGSGRWPQ